MLPGGGPSIAGNSPDTRQARSTLCHAWRWEQLTASQASRPARTVASSGDACRRSSQSTASARNGSPSSVAGVTELDPRLPPDDPAGGNAPHNRRDTEPTFKGGAEKHPSRSASGSVEPPRGVKNRLLHELVSADDRDAEVVGDGLQGPSFEAIHAEGDARALRQLGQRFAYHPELVAIEQHPFRARRVARQVFHHGHGRPRCLDRAAT